MKNAEAARWAVTLLVLGGGAVWFFALRTPEPPAPDVELPGEPPALPGSRVEGRDVSDAGLGPVHWGVEDSEAVLAEIQRRLDEHGEATVRLDPDYPTALTDAAFVEEVDALAARLDTDVVGRGGALPFVRVLSAERDSLP